VYERVRVSVRVRASVKPHAGGIQHARGQVLRTNNSDGRGVCLDSCLGIQEVNPKP
jgi:hypothetical protein